ncbi:MAG: hypothetical protein ACI9LA_000870 [Bacteroidia bacterium]|jgi:hypothetical protein
MKRFTGLLLTLLAVLTGHNVFGQMVIDNTQTAMQLVEDVLLGQGVVVSNISFTGDAVQIGYFDAANANFSIPEGVVMSTGNVNDIPDAGGGFASTIVGGPGDADLDIIETAGTNDAIVLQFDFVPTGDSIRFSYVFASEEYPEWVGAGFNDAFAFTISGPGFAGPFANGGENIALLPGTATPVSIDNVNDGLNNQYYVDNQTGGADGVVFDGYTVTLTALAQVVCGETYTLKFVVGDGGDSSFDSGVFLEARSFNSNAVNVDISTASGSVEEGGGWIVEGCTPADITFTRPAAAADTTDAIPVYISGSAINGTDYTGVPDTVFFEVGDTSITFTIDAIDDILNEVGDSIVITVFSLNLCGDTIVSTGTIQIYDSGFYSYETEITGENSIECAGDSVLLVASSMFGNPAYDYDWNNFLTGDSIWIVPTGDTTLIVETEDACGTETSPVIFEIQYLVNPDPTVNITGPESFNCVPQIVNLNAAGSLGNTPYVYLWDTGSGSSSISPTITSDTVFSVVAIDQCGVTSEPDTIYISQNAVSVPTVQTSLDVTLNCPGETATLTAIASGGVQPYDYSWSITGEVTSTINVQPTQTTEYVITVTDDCYEGEITDTILVTVEAYIVMTLSLSDTTVMCPGDAVLLEAIVSNGNNPINISWSDSNTGSTDSFNADATTTLTVTADDDCGNSVNADVTVTVPVFDAMTSAILNADLILGDGDTVVVCEVWSDTLASVVSGGLPPYTYQWNGMFVEGSVTNDSATVTIPYELDGDTTITGIHTLTVTDQCLEETTSDVVVQAINCDIIQPGIFNPNSDFGGTSDFCGNTPQNNVFNLPCLNLYPGNTMTIMDRWGRKCYQVENYHLAPWDGGNQSEGTYFYVCELLGGKEAVKGYFQLVR